ncbi:MAG: hypothetical protein KC656_29840, partial [Myxococcales bacterium]|nr:hypothetical protein [Myxococcales bacterium]
MILLVSAFAQDVPETLEPTIVEPVTRVEVERKVPEGGGSPWALFGNRLEPDGIGGSVAVGEGV